MQKREIRTQHDLEKEKARLRLLVRYQQKDLKGLLLRLPGEFLASGIEANLPKFARRKIVYKAIDAIRMGFAGGLNSILMPKHEKNANKNVLFSPFNKMRMFGSAFKAYRLIKRYRKPRVG